MCVYLSLLLATNLGTHAAFIWGRYRVFRIDTKTPLGIRLIEISAVSSILIGVCLIITRDGPGFVLDMLALGLALGSIGLFVWGVATVHCRTLAAAYTNDVPTELITVGPFRYVRHPFYLSYLLCYLQAVLLSRSVWAVVPLLWMAGIYVRAALLEEQNLLKGSLAKEYCQYAAHTGRFLPRTIHKLEHPHGG